MFASSLVLDGQKVTYAYICATVRVCTYPRLYSVIGPLKIRYQWEIDTFYLLKYHRKLCDLESFSVLRSLSTYRTHNAFGRKRRCRIRIKDVLVLYNILRVHPNYTLGGGEKENTLNY